MDVSLALEQLAELGMRALEDLGNSGCVGDEGSGSDLADGWHGAEGGESTIGDPRNKVGRVLALVVVDGGLDCLLEENLDCTHCRAC